MVSMKCTWEKTWGVATVGLAGLGYAWMCDVRGLEDLVHAFRTESALDEIANGNGADESVKTGILALLLGGALFKDLVGVERLHAPFVSHDRLEVTAV